MEGESYAIRDACRARLVPYTLRALAAIPLGTEPSLLDAGCGTGVPTLAVARVCGGRIDAVDTDAAQISWLQTKVNAAGMAATVRAICGSITDTALCPGPYDAVIAEGLLNVIGTERGLRLLVDRTRHGGHLLIHDEYANDAYKRALFSSMGLALVYTAVLDPSVWWEEYYSCLDDRIRTGHDPNWYQAERDEIAAYRRHPDACASIYYVLKKE